MKIETDSLIGAALDWAVAQCEGIEVVAWYTKDGKEYFVVRKEAFVDKEPTTFYGDPEDTFYPSKKGDHGEPIIERELMNIEVHWNTRGCGIRTGVRQWSATHPKNYAGLIRYHGHGPTMLIATMRCFVASKLGNEVDVPDELAPYSKAEQ